MIGVTDMLNVFATRNYRSVSMVRIGHHRMSVQQYEQRRRP